MNTNTKMVMIAAVAAAVGIVIGWAVWGNRAPGMHRMPDGSWMNNDGTMASMMHTMNAGLEGKTGDAFDREFLDEMIVHHEGAVDMAKLVLQTSKRPELIKLANDIIAAQTKEIQMMKDWRAAWFK